MLLLTCVLRNSTHGKMDKGYTLTLWNLVSQSQGIEVVRNILIYGVKSPQNLIIKRVLQLLSCRAPCCQAISIKYV
jgi:hypothetical protein